MLVAVLQVLFDNVNSLLTISDVGDLVIDVEDVLHQSLDRNDHKLHVLSNQDSVSVAFNRLVSIQVLWNILEHQLGLVIRRDKLLDRVRQVLGQHSRVLVVDSTLLDLFLRWQLALETESKSGPNALVGDQPDLASEMLSDTAANAETHASTVRVKGLAASQLGKGLEELALVLQLDAAPRVNDLHSQQPDVLVFLAVVEVDDHLDRASDDLEP